MHDIPIEIDGHDLKKNAIHYPGTALPGLVGNTVIFGHSSLPYFFKPLNPLTIFNPLVDAQRGQVITIKYDGVDYSYSITDKFQVTPKQVEVLSQNTSNREITLITCVPLGTYWHRLIIKGQMIKSL
jgi:sortase A